MSSTFFFNNKEIVAYFCADGNVPAERKIDDTGKREKIARVMSLSKQERENPVIRKWLVLGEHRLLPHYNRKGSRMYGQPWQGANVMG